MQAGKTLWKSENPLISQGISAFVPFSGTVMAPPVGLEPTTTRLTAECSTDWAKEEYGAPSGIRTRDPLIKSQLLYQLS